MSRPPSSLSSFGSDTNVMAVSDTLCVVSPTNPISYEPSVDEIPGAQLPGEIPGLLSCESGHNLGGKSHITTLESVNSTFGSAESTQSFDEDEDEVHDFLEKVRKFNVKLLIFSCHSYPGRVVIDARYVQVDGS
jgi:hypothetical protein